MYSKLNTENVARVLVDCITLQVEEFLKGGVYKKQLYTTSTNEESLRRVASDMITTATAWISELHRHCSTCYNL